MPNYRRPFAPGGTFFFTRVTAERTPTFADAAPRRLLRHAIAATRAERPFDLVAIVLLPDHLHAIWTLPHGDADFSRRWALIKGRFTHAYLAAGRVEAKTTAAWAKRRGRGVWQQRFFDHQVRDEPDLHNHLDYIHFNPVKHGLTKCPHAWPHSLFQQWVARGGYAVDWCCACAAPAPTPPRFDWAQGRDME